MSHQIVMVQIDAPFQGKETCQLEKENKQTQSLLQKFQRSPLVHSACLLCFFFLFLRIMQNIFI